jgi:magnesium-transporting ATPase (P-type)
MEWHSTPAADVCSRWQTDPERGLTTAESARRLRQHGPNALAEPPRRAWHLLVLKQLASPLIYLLLAAAALAFGLGHPSDAMVILVVVILNTVIGVIQESRAERSLLALRKLAAVRARVRREGQDQLIEASELVPGDLLIVAAGDAITADARLLSAKELRIAEAALTGEAAPVSKQTAELDDVPLADRTNMVYSGTHATAGRGEAVVVATGAQTEVGKIAHLAEQAVEPKTPMELRIARLGRLILLAAVGLFALVLLLGWARGIPLREIALIAVSQMVSLVPEGLPVALTIALAVGVQRMAKRGAIVRRLVAVETLGSTTVVCSDKTGTLTRNEMTVTELFLPSGRSITVTGAGYRPEGDLREDGRAIPVDGDGDLRALLEAGVLCNDAGLSQPEDGSTWRAIGDPTEAALIAAALKASIVPEELRAARPRQAEIPFDSQAKLMATHHGPAEQPTVIIKGAPEQVLELADRALIRGERQPLDPDGRRAVVDAAQGMAHRALRVLAAAEVPGGAIDERAGFDPFRNKATFLGLFGQLDPPRTEVAPALEACRSAGVRPVMVTGDHQATALAIAGTLGISGPDRVAIDTRELAGMGDDELDRRIDSVALFARVEPAQKLRIVEAYQRASHVVAMTGDGVNDAPALARADVGVAMGIAGTEVAKASADIVITDDNFATIVAAVEEGRVVHRNTKKILLLFFSTAVAEVIVLLAAVIAGFPPPFAAVQILWNNLVTEGLITVNLAMEPPEGDEMKSPPARRDEPLVSTAMAGRIGLMAAAITLSTLGWFILRLSTGASFPVAQTETFTVLAICEWFNVLNCRSGIQSVFRQPLARNRWLLGGLLLAILLQAAVVYAPPLNRPFHTVPIDLDQLLVLALVASPVLWVEELRKVFARRAAAAARQPGR